MNRTDRLTGIILALQDRRQTAAQLAVRFEVSRRTILRDVDALSQIGVPIVAIPGAGGGLGLAEDYWLKPVHLTTAEASALLVAARSLSAHPNGPMSASARTAAEKLRAALRPEVLSAAEQVIGRVQLAPPRHADRLGSFQIVDDAIAAETWLRITYGSLRRVASHAIFPISLIEIDGFWHCSAVSHEVRSVRQFRLDRIISVEATPPPANADDVRRLAAAPGPAYDDPNHPEIAVTLDYRGARMAEDLPRRGGVLRQIDDSTWDLRFRCPPSELDYWARTFFGFADHARVRAPAELREMILALIRATANRYGEAPK
ncbi:MAG TPA: WYL domain-containing protein [Thermomicrobiales bacterium]